MLRDDTLVVEMTGIMGAGYLPGFFTSLSQLLEEKYLRVSPEGLRPLISYYHVDNTAALNSDGQRHARISTLIGKAPHLAPAEWDELRDGLAWADELMQKRVQKYRKPVDIVLRRGGLLQTYILLGGTRWEEATINRRWRPKLQVFLTADLPTIAHTFAEDHEVRKALKENPDAYCRSPEHAHANQEKWLHHVKDLPGLITVKRREQGKEAFAVEVLTRIVPLLKHFGFETVSQRHLFISYSTKDLPFVDKLEEDLRRQDLRIWIDRQEILVGDSLIAKISEGIESSAYAAAIISRNSIKSQWVQKELEILINRSIDSGRRNVLPFVIESGLTLPLFLRGIRHLDFANRGFDECIKELMARLAHSE